MRAASAAAAAAGCFRRRCRPEIQTAAVLLCRLIQQRVDAQVINSHVIGRRLDGFAVRMTPEPTVGERRRRRQRRETVDVPHVIRTAVHRRDTISF